MGIHCDIESREYELICSRHREPPVSILSEGLGQFGRGGEWEKKGSAFTS